MQQAPSLARRLLRLDLGRWGSPTFAHFEPRRRPFRLLGALGPQPPPLGLCSGPRAHLDKRGFAKHAESLQAFGA
eukprot:1257313-Alexandrium_andersonii.AAC.1